VLHWKLAACSARYPLTSRSTAGFRGHPPGRPGRIGDFVDSRSWCRLYEQAFDPWLAGARHLCGGPFSPGRSVPLLECRCHVGNFLSGFSMPSKCPRIVTLCMNVKLKGTYFIGISPLATSFCHRRGPWHCDRVGVGIDITRSGLPQDATTPRLTTRREP